jgi:hypothetical protein
VRLTRAVVAAVLACLAMLAGVVAVPGGLAAAALLRPALPAAGESTSLSLEVAPAVVATGRPVTLHGRLTDTATGSAGPADAVRVEAAAADGSWVEVAALTTDLAGDVTTVQAPTATTVYRLHHGVPGSSQESVSAAVKVTVRALTAELVPDAVRVGQPVDVQGVLAADPGSELRLEQRIDGAWRPAGSARTAADGSYRFTVTPAEPGFSQFRVVRDAGATWSRSVATPAPLDVFRLHTYSITTRGKVRADLAVFRSVVAATYADPHGWLRAHHRFREVPREGDFTVVLSQASRLPAFSWECSTTYSCRVGRHVIINQDRWQRGSPHFPADLLTYRRMLIDHETGHWLGRGHAYCPGPGAPAPVMQQQSKGMQGCRPNPWPRPREIAAVS